MVAAVGWQWAGGCRRAAGTPSSRPCLRPGGRGTLGPMTSSRTAPRAPRGLFLALSLLTGAALACDEPGLAADAISELEIERMAQRAAQALADHADVDLPAMPPILLLTNAEARERRQAYTAALAESDETRFAKAVDAMADQLMGEAMLGRYLPDEKVIYIFEDVLLAQVQDDLDEARGMLFGLLAHELVHAYDDQVHEVMVSPGDLVSMLEDPAQIMGIQTLMSLLEGRATFASELACLGVGEIPLDVPTEEDVRGARLVSGGGSVAGEALADVGNGLARMKLMQYVQGYRFSREAWRYGGERFFEHVFGSLPLSLAELEDFEAFKLRWAEELEERLMAEEDAAAAAEAGA
mgnify:CR=1 FL=1